MLVDAQTNHLILFFDEEWNKRGDIHSYGHDIEAAWLVQEVAEIIGDKALIEEVKKRSVKVADAALEGLDKDGGLWYEYNAEEKHLIKEKHSWPQAEAMVSYLNAWQITNDESYLQKSLNSWKFVKNYIRHKEKGEWYWGITDTYTSMAGQDKVGLWKCSYHNSRACIEIVKRITNIRSKVA